MPTARPATTANGTVTPTSSQGMRSAAYENMTNVRTAHATMSRSNAAPFAKRHTPPMTPGRMMRNSYVERPTM